jgi:hypothetical protein
VKHILCHTLSMPLCSSDRGLKSLKPCARINPSYLKLFCEVFCHNDDSLTDTA